MPNWYGSSYKNGGSGMKRIKGSLRENILDSGRIQQTKNAEKIIRCLKDGARDVEMVRTVLTDYICYKFMLDESDFTCDNLITLAKISISKAVKNKEVHWDQKDCHGTTESMTKKIMLISSIERNLGITFSRQEYMDLDTVDDLANIIFQKIG